jgi:hypothetical protein
MFELNEFFYLSHLALQENEIDLLLFDQTWQGRLN